MRRMLLLAGLVAGCESGTVSHSLADSTRAANVFLKVGDGTSAQAIELYLSTASTVTSIGLCALTSETATCDASTSGYVTATSLGLGKERMYFRAQLDVADAGRVYHVYDTQGRQVISKFRLTDSTVNPIDAGLALIAEANLRRELTDLASDGRNGRLAGTPENEQAAESIIVRLKEMGIEPARPNTYLQEFTLAVGPMAGKKTANIVATLPGTDPALKGEYVVIGAHMDHAGTLQRGYTCSPGGSGDNICNGADDNGSGTIAVLNVAKALAATRANLKRTVVLIWFSGEEEGLLGSRHYVRNDPIFPLNKTVYMINLDMVGYMSSNGNALAALGGGTSNVGEKIIEEIGRKYPDRSVRISVRAGGGSDHVPFMEKGIPGVFFHTGVANNRNYHKTSDSPDKIDYAGMLMATKVAFETVYRVANDTSLSVRFAGERAPLVTEEEAQQTCHHLMQNPFIAETLPDFKNGNDGVP